MFGYATDETEEYMPLTIVLAHKLNAKLAELRRSGDFSWLRPDSKTQVIEIGNLFSTFLLTSYQKFLLSTNLYFITLAWSLYASAWICVRTVVLE